MIALNRIYTKAGDTGDTGLGDGKRVSKDSLRVQSIGAVDEANAAIGVARLDAPPELDAMLERIQNDLFDLGADLCLPENAGERSQSALRIEASQVTRLEAEIDSMNSELAPLTSFILPGGTPAAAYLHLARTIVRRAERDMVALMAHESINPQMLRYLNRLSDHLFVAARIANAKGADDVLWTPGAHR
jgi:cob(I)alamin adenosyltransferase